MRKILFVLALLSPVMLCAQRTVEDYVSKGVKLHDDGDYDAALEQYGQALKIDPNSALAHYEMASTYFAKKDYEQAIIHADKVIKNKKEYVDQACILKGSALDLQGKPKEAIKTYQQGLKVSPNNHLLHYNLALTYYNQRQLPEAESALMDAIRSKRSHPSSHLLMGYVMDEQHSRIKAILSLCNFLLLEPSTRRSTSAYDLLMKLMGQGVEQKDEHTINITVPAGGQDDEFRTAEVTLSLMVASNSVEENKGKTGEELFAKNLGALFSSLSVIRKDKKGFWWETYVDFFASVQDKGYLEPMAYYISQASGKSAVKEWLADHEDQVNEMLSWTGKPAK